MLTGLKLALSSGSSFLKMGVIFAALRLSGKQPVSMDLFMQLVNILNVNSLSFNIWIGIFPPADLLFLDLE